MTATSRAHTERWQHDDPDPARHALQLASACHIAPGIAIAGSAFIHRCDGSARSARRRQTAIVTVWEAWEEHAASWIEWARRPDHDGFWEGTWPELAALLPPSRGLVVDVGCGEGRAGRELQRLGYRVVGVERSRALADAAHQHRTP